MKEYKIFLDDVLIGTTNFEFADVPMGVVYGKVNFIDFKNPYFFFKKYCDSNDIDYQFIDDEKYIQTFELKLIKISNNSDFIRNGASFCGFDEDFQIEMYNISSEIMKSEFLHHYYDYYGETD
jgi:hypothetical protein